MKFISNSRIVPTAVLIGACFAFTGAALGSTASASSTTAASSAAAAGPVVVRCNGLVVTDKVPANFVGIYVPANPTANNVILGRSIRDVIKSGPGNDTVCALGGDDEIWGEGGNDTFFSGSGNDRNLGGGGIDNFDCGSGSSDVANGGGEVGDFARANCESQFDIPA